VDKTHQFMGFEEMEKQNDNSITLVHVLKVYFDSYWIENLGAT